MVESLHSLPKKHRCFLENGIDTTNVRLANPPQHDSTTPARSAVVDDCELTMGVAPYLPANMSLPKLTSLHRDKLFWQEHTHKIYYC